MKITEIMDRIKAGEILTILDYRGGKAEKIIYDEVNKKTGQKTGQKAEFDKISHTVESATESFKVMEDSRTIPNFDLKTWKTPFKRGDKVVFICEGYSKNFGDSEGKGKLVLLEA